MARDAIASPDLRCGAGGAAHSGIDLILNHMTVEDIALTFVPRLGVRGAVHLLNRFGSAAAVYSASEAELCGRGELRPDVARAIVSRKGMREAERELQYCSRWDITPVASTDDAYPPLLREVCDYPAVVYVRGDVSVLLRRCLAFVGTRRMTSYGSRMCETLLRELSALAPDAVVVSGLAYGIDSACHHAALANGLATVGVLANSLPAVSRYPT